ncbi:MAG: hypothetical protein ACR2OB_14610 [Solirubrobacteraceae bacterium]
MIVFASGIVLMFDGPHYRGSWLLIHKASFIVWAVSTALHVLGHLSSVGGSLRAVGLSSITITDRLQPGKRRPAPPGSGLLTSVLDRT